MREVRAITFDAGHTLVELDTGMLAARLAEQGIAIAPAALDAAWPSAWACHEREVARGARHPWKVVFAALLDLAGCPAARIDALVEWLWNEQPRRNLFRRPVPGMRELVTDLHAAGVPMAVLSNSEGKLGELLDELDWSRYFVAIADSGKLGVAKPDPGIFQWTVERLGVPAASVVHVGDSREADVAGAVAAGLRAVWFGPGAHDLGDERVTACRDVAELRRVLAAWGVPGA